MKQYGRTLPKDIEGLIDLARQQDWHISKTTSGHWRLTNPRGRMVIHSGTPSDANALWNFRAELKRHGLKPGKVRIVKVAPPEPKMVIDKSVKEKSVEEKVNVPTLPGEAAVVASAKKTRKTIPGIRGGKLRDAIIHVLRKNDKPDGLRIDELDTLVREYMKIDGIRVAATVGYYTKLFTRVGHGRYRLAELVAPTPAPAPSATEEDDEVILIEFLERLDKVANIVKKHVELQKVLKQLQKLGTNK